MRAQSHCAAVVASSVALALSAEIIAAIPFQLTDAQSQGTKVASTVARGGKI